MSDDAHCITQVATHYPELIQFLQSNKMENIVCLQRHKISATEDGESRSTTGWLLNPVEVNQIKLAISSGDT